MLQRPDVEDSQWIDNVHVEAVMTEAERAELLAAIAFLALKLAGALQQSQARSEIIRARKEER